MAAAGQGQKSGGHGPARSYARVLVTFVFTLALVSGEFALLNGVYHRADPTRRQLLTQSRLAAHTADAQRLLARSPALTTEVVTRQVLPDLDLALRAFTRDDLPDDQLSRLVTIRTALSEKATAEQRATEQPAEQPAVEQPATTTEAPPDQPGAGEPAALTALTAEVDSLGRRLTDRQKSLDLQAGLIYGGLLVIVSVGWFLWFRRLVARHRALQQAVTEQEALASSEQRLLALVQNGSDVVTVLDVDSTISFVSPSAKSVLGVAAEDLLGTRVIELIDPDDVPLLNQQMAGLRAGEDETVLLRMRHGDGRTLVIEGMLTNLLANPMIGGFVLTVRDVTERQALQSRLTYQAFHDALTGLANRQLFADRLAHALLRRPGDARPLVVLVCDLDDFKDVNDSLGHGIGDQVLEVVGQRIRTTIRAADTAARLGGDEFAILMEAIGTEEAEGLAERLVAVVAEPMMIDGRRLTVTACVGMAQAVPGENTTEETLRNADVALHSAKDRGKSVVAAYDSGLHAEALDRLELRADLQRALRDGELVLHYQPTVEVDSGKITGFEALVRWQHPTRGLLSPAFFVAMAEETGMIVQLGTWVLFEACRTAALLQSDWRHPTMAVNISVQQLMRTDFVAQVTQALAEAGLAADRLTLEITESVVLQDLDDVIPRLSALRERGTRVAIDDFGTGYSSLAYLTELPVDVLKVDKSFIDRVTLDEQAASLTEAIISMSQAMHLTTVAEGVESAEQAAWLRKVRCPIGQGYYWSRPVDLPGVQELLARATEAPDGPPQHGSTTANGAVSSNDAVRT
jgi:diguanylate cyclase (GGDEF)-like protein/PAS domain S-box-containing protein